MATVPAGEAERLLDALFDATWPVVCPPDEARRETCQECDGTAVNPPGSSEPGDPPAFAPGQPCWLCGRTDRPGTTMPCARPHHESGTVTPGETLLTSAERASLRLLHRLDELCQAGDLPAVHAAVHDAINGLTFD